MVSHIYYIVLTWCVTYIIMYSHGVSHSLYCTHMVCYTHNIVVTWFDTSIIL